MATPKDEYEGLPMPYRVGVWLRLVAFVAVVAAAITALIAHGWSLIFVSSLLAALALVPTHGETLAERALGALVEFGRARRDMPSEDDGAAMAHRRRSRRGAQPSRAKRP